MPTPLRLAAVVLAGMASLAWIACDPETSAQAPADPASAPSSPLGHAKGLSPERRLLRASLMLRGIRPQLDEYARLGSDGEGYEAIVDEYLGSPELGPTLRHMHGEWLLTDTFKDYYPMNFPLLAQFAGRGRWQLNADIGDAPARLAEFIVMEDRPYTDLATADYTLANADVAAVWGLEHDGPDEAWLPVRFADGRAQSGLLTDPWYFVRHASTPTNRQRARAAHIARALLCHDYMSRAVRVPAGIDLTSGGANSLTKNPVCISCHSTLDEFGSFFTPHEGVIIPESQWRYPIDTRATGAADDYPEPSFYGTVAQDLLELGELIADDSRFARCAVRRFYGQMLAVDEVLVPHAAEDRLVQAFIDGGFRVKSLLRAIALSDAFAADGSEAPPRATTADATGLRRLSPWHLARSIEDLTGFRWATDVDYDDGGGRVGRLELMRDISWGYRSLAGGADGFFRFEALRTADPTTLLVLRSLAGAAAGHVVARDLGRAGGLLEVDAQAGEAAVRAQLADLHLRLYGERVAADSAIVDADWALFESGGGAANAPRAWQLVVMTMLMDPRMLFV